MNLHIQLHREVDSSAKIHKKIEKPRNTYAFFLYNVSDCNILTFQNLMSIVPDMMRGNQESIILVRKSPLHDTFLTAISMLFL